MLNGSLAVKAWSARIKPAMWLQVALGCCCVMTSGCAPAPTSVRTSGTPNFARQTRRSATHSPRRAQDRESGKRLGRAKIWLSTISVSRRVLLDEILPPLRMPGLGIAVHLRAGQIELSSAAGRYALTPKNGEAWFVASGTRPVRWTRSAVRQFRQVRLPSFIRSPPSYPGISLIRPPMARGSVSARLSHAARAMKEHRWARARRLLGLAKQGAHTHYRGHRRAELLLYIETRLLDIDVLERLATRPQLTLEQAEMIATGVEALVTGWQTTLSSLAKRAASSGSRWVVAMHYRRGAVDAHVARWFDLAITRIRVPAQVKNSSVPSGKGYRRRLSKLRSTYLYRLADRARLGFLRCAETAARLGVPVDAKHRAKQRFFSADAPSVAIEIDRVWAKRRTPSDSLADMPVRLSPNRIALLSVLLGERTILFLGPCAKVKPARNHLAEYATTIQASGLRAVALASDTCSPPQASPRLWNRLGVNRGSSLDRTPVAVILDRAARVRYRSPPQVQPRVAFQGTLAHLRSNWPPFAASNRVSVVPSPSVDAATSQRKMRRVESAVAKGRYGEALAILDSLVAADPTLADARKRRAVIRARVRGRSAALEDVRWWRKRFGDVAADRLMDEVAQAAKGSSRGVDRR